MRADAMLKKGELGGYGVWKPILRAVVVLGCEIQEIWVLDGRSMTGEGEL